MSFLIRKPLGLLTVAGLTAVGVLVASQAASAFIYRAKAAGPLNVSMVPAYDPCTAPNGTPAGNTHNPTNLPGPACNPPTKTSTRLTVGSLAQNTVPNFRVASCCPRFSGRPITLPSRQPARRTATSSRMCVVSPAMPRPPVERGCAPIQVRATT